MSKPIIIRGTTPTLVLEDLDQDLSDGWTVYVTFEWDVWARHERLTGQITKSGNDVVATEDSVSVSLTQEDTLAFPEKGGNGELPRVGVQIRAYKGGNVIATDADDDSVYFYVGSAFLESEIPLEA